MSRVGDGAAFSACNFAESNLPAVTTCGEGTACGVDRSFGQICPSSRKLPPSFGQPQLNGGTRMFEKFTRHLSGTENDGANTGESFKIATPGSSLDCASTGSHPSMVPIWKVGDRAAGTQ